MLRAPKTWFQPCMLLCTLLASFSSRKLEAHMMLIRTKISGPGWVGILALVWILDITIIVGHLMVLVIDSLWVSVLRIVLGVETALVTTWGIQLLELPHKPLFIKIIVLLFLELQNRLLLLLLLNLSYQGLLPFLLIPLSFLNLMIITIKKQVLWTIGIAWRFDRPAVDELSRLSRCLIKLWRWVVGSQIMIVAFNFLIKFQIIVFLLLLFNSLLLWVDLYLIFESSLIL